MIREFVATFATAAVLCTTASAETYIIDTEGAHASISFKADHLGFSFLTGRFDTFSGTFEFDPTQPENGSVSIEIDAASINSNHDRRDTHLRSEDFFFTESFPTATFESTSINVLDDTNAVITGDLTIRGVTQGVDIAATYVGGGPGPRETFRQGFSGTTSIIPSDFGMTHGVASAPVVLALEVEGIRQ